MTLKEPRKEEGKVVQDNKRLLDHEKIKLAEITIITDLTWDVNKKENLLVHM